MCSYSNFHNDPNPLLFCLYSDGKYTVGLNLHYLLPTQRFAFFGMIRKLAAVGQKQNMVFHYNGEMLYEIIKKYYPRFAKIAYRKYFSMYLMGTLVNDCLNAASPLMNLYLKAQNLQSQASENLLEKKAKNEPYANEVNKYLKDTRSKGMNDYEDVKFNMKKLPGPSVIPPDQTTPQQGEDKIHPVGPTPPGL